MNQKIIPFSLIIMGMLVSGCVTNHINDTPTTDVPTPNNNQSTVIVQNYNGGISTSMNNIWFYMWLMQPSYCCGYYGSFNSNYYGGTYFVKQYPTDDENGWSVKSPEEYEVKESTDGQVVEDMGFAEPQIPEGYVPPEEVTTEEQTQEDITQSQEQAVQEAQDSQASQSSQDADSNTVGDADSTPSHSDSSDSGDSGESDSGEISVGGDD